MPSLPCFGSVHGTPFLSFRCQLSSTPPRELLGPTGKDLLQGTVFVTGPTDDDGDLLPLAQEIIDLFIRMEKLHREGPEE